MRRVMMTGLGAAMMLEGLAAISAMAPMPAAEPEPGSARNRPSGSKPVSGGGAKERARRLARMSKQSQE